MKPIEKMIGIGMLVFAIGFNLWLYRLEPTATIDPNDNAFQFALVERTNQILDYAQQRCASLKLKAQSSKLALFSPLRHFALCTLHFTLLFDHWVPNWAQGYNLPFYYSHVPQIIIVASYRFLQLFAFRFSLFAYYHWVIYLLLSLFPLSVFLALRACLPAGRSSSYLAAGIGALLAGHISTDGLYGLDPPSFLWRGYGLSSQLFAMIWMPLALAYSYRFFEDGKWKFLNLNFLTSRCIDQNFKKSKNRNQKYQENPSSRIHNINFFRAVLFTTLTAMGHLGLGIIAMLSLVPLALASPILHLLNHQPTPTVIEVTKNELTKLLMLAGTVIFFLSYWIVPIFLNDNYHNISFWDPPWKFASYGARETITRLLNGDLFDWGRGPWMTTLVIVGLIAAAWPRRTDALKMENLETLDIETLRSRNLDQNIKSSRHRDQGYPSSTFSFSLLFVFWLLLYFGRGTWGGLIDLIPGMKEFHLSRFIVGVHIAGLFLMPIGVGQILAMIRFPIIKIITVITIITIIGIPIYKQTISYAQHNDRLIKQANESHAKVKTDEKALFTAIGGLPHGRVFAGRGGWWGRDFRVAETPWYMHLSTYGIPTVLWLPQTWSPNSDVEQYFSEDQAKDYDLFGIRYVAAPPSQKPQHFWKLIDERETWKLYEIESSVVSLPAGKAGRQSSDNTKIIGYFATGVRPAVVATDKRSYGNVVRLWIQSDAHTKGLYPELTFAKDYPRTTGLPNFKMLNEVTYIVPDLPAGRQVDRHNLFKEPPVYMVTGDMKQETGMKITEETNDSDMVFKANVEVPEGCRECIVVLKQSFHPNWKATIDGKTAQTFTVFPFYLATLVPSGTHEVVFSYEPGGLKVILLTIELTVILVLLISATQRRRWKYHFRSS